MVEQGESSTARTGHVTGGLDRLIEITKLQEHASRTSDHQPIGDNLLPVRTPWLAYTKWLERFAGQNMERLTELTEKPKSGDHFLMAVWKDAGNMFKDCHRGLKDICTREWDRILFWLKSSRRDAVARGPMNVHIKEKTVGEYSSYLQRFLCFCFRVLDLPIAHAQDGGFRFTDEQREYLEEAREYYQFMGGDDEDADGMRRRMLVKLCMSFIRQEVYEVGVPALVYFMGILGHRKNTGQWREPEYYTNMLAGTLWCMRALVLEFSLPLDRRDEFGMDKIRNPINRVKEVRDLWLVEESECPFATLHSLMNYGFVLAKQAVGVGKVRWSEDREKLLFRGHVMDMEQWKEFVLGLLETVERMLNDELMFQRDGRLPDVNLWNVEDDQGREDVGYYFGAVSTDQWDDARKQMGHWLVESGDPVGLLGDQDEGGVQEFMQTGVDNYNALDTKFRILLFLVVLFLSGGPPRGTETTSMKYMNTREGQRNVFVFLGMMMTVTEFHKSQAITMQQKVNELYSIHNLTLAYCTIPMPPCSQSAVCLPPICGSVPPYDQWQFHVGRECMAVWRFARPVEDGDLHEGAEITDGEGIRVGDDIG
jgi:hypothetical protein